MSTIGLIHTIFSVVAILAGTAVVLMQKGTRWHRTLGHIYLTSMLALNISALFIYRLFDGFGPFHGLAIYSLVILVVGMVPVFVRRPKNSWLRWHAAAISGSYVGLLAAFAAEITSRLPGSEEHFGIVVTITSVVVNLVGFYLILRNVPNVSRRLPDRFMQTSLRDSLS